MPGGDDGKGCVGMWSFRDGFSSRVACTLTGFCGRSPKVLTRCDSHGEPGAAAVPVPAVAVVDVVRVGRVQWVQESRWEYYGCCCRQRWSFAQVVVTMSQQGRLKKSLRLLLLLRLLELVQQ